MQQCLNNFDEIRFILIRLKVASNKNINFKIKFGPIFFGNNSVFKGIISNFLMVVKVVILCFFFKYQISNPALIIQNPFSFFKDCVFKYNSIWLAQNLIYFSIQILNKRKEKVQYLFCYNEELFHYRIFV